MAFPGGLSPRVDLFYSGIWNDITSDVMTRNAETAITIRRGRDSEDSADVPASCTMSLRNTTGKYSPRNPTSALFGLIGRNTPIRVGIGSPALGASSHTTVDSTNLIAPAVIAEASSLQISAWAATPTGNITVPGGFTADTESDPGAMTINTARKSVGAGTTGTATATFSVTATSQATATVVIPGATYVATTQVSITAGADANHTLSLTAGQFVVAMQAWSDDLDDRMQPPKIQGDRGAGWYAITDSGVSTEAAMPRITFWGWWVPTTATYTISSVGRRDAVGTQAFRLFQLSGVTAYYARFSGEVSEFPVTWNKHSNDVWTPIEAGGAARRLSQTNQISGGSSIYEAFIRRNNTLEYWPLEDASSATQFASALTNGNPMTFATSSLAPTLGLFTSLPGSDPLPEFASAGAGAVVRAYTSTGQLSFGQVIRFAPGGGTAGANIFRVEFSTGTIGSFLLEYTSDTTITRKIFDRDGVSISSGTLAAPSDGINGEVYMLLATLATSGSDVVTNVQWYRMTPGFEITQPTFLSYTATTLTTQTLGLMSRYFVGVEQNGSTIHSSGTYFGHPFVASTTNAFNTNDYDLAEVSPSSLVAWYGQKASDRIYRLCTDSMVRVNVGHNDTDQRLGYQVPGTLYDQIREAAATGVGGQLSDAPGFLGMNWREMESKESKPARLTFSYTGSTLTEPLYPTDDDRLTVNDQTIVRRGGSSGRAVLTSGALSTAQPPNGVGLYRDEEQLSLFKDSQTQPIAAWMLSMGTVDQSRWPVLAFNLGVSGNSAKIDTMKFLALGDTISLTNLPTFVAPGGGPAGAALLIVEGLTETIGFTMWELVLNLSSATGLQTFFAESSGYDRVGDDGFQTLTTTVTSTATSISATTSSGAVLTNAAGDLPFSIFITGEELSVTAVGGATSPQTLTVTRSVNGVVKAQTAGAVITVARAAIAALGGI